MSIESIAYCGLYCAECPNHTGVIANLARDLRKELRTFRFDKTAELLSQYSFFKEFKKYEDCYTVLGTMVKIRCGKTCRNGGGNPTCKIKNCVRKKKIQGCWECNDFETCEKLQFLQTNHGVAHLKNIRIIKKKGIEEKEVFIMFLYKYFHRLAKELNMKCILFIFTFLSIASMVFAQAISYDIEQYDLYIQPDFVTKSLFMSTTITINNPTLQDTFYFGLNDRYEKVTVKSNASPVSIQRENGWICIFLQKPTRHFKLVFETKGIIGKSDSENRQVITDSSLFLLWSDRFYPIDFNHWAKVKTTIILPDDFLPIAPGKLIRTKKHSKMIDHTFITTNPAVCFSVFADSRWIVTKRKINGIQMQTLLYPESQKFSEQIFKTSREILKFYSETYCAYPFDQFSFITLDSICARRAFPGFVGYSPGYLEKEFTTTGFDAHETALLWWFYTIRGDGPGSFQWTEGFGDYAEFLYDEKYQKPIPKIFQYFRKEYLAMPSQEDVLYYDLTGNTPQQIVHGKYPWLMHLIRYEVGDEKFGEEMKLIFKKFRFRTFTMDELIAILEEGCGQTLQWWRQEWLERKGFPVITFKSEVLDSGNGYLIKCILTQVENLYHLPIEIGIESEKGIDIKRVNITEQQTIFTFESDEKPINITLDPNGWLLLKIIYLK